MTMPNRQQIKNQKQQNGDWREKSKSATFVYNGTRYRTEDYLLDKSKRLRRKK